MPDLHEDAVHAFWDSYDRRTLYRIIVALEQVEHWTIDKDSRVESALLRLGESIDQLGDFEMNEEGRLVRVLANTHAGRALRILQALDLEKPGTASQLLMFAEEAEEDAAGSHQSAKLFLKRNLIFERLQLLSRVFAPQRLSLVLKALEQYNE